MLASTVSVSVDVGVPGIVKLAEDNPNANSVGSYELVRDPLPTKFPNGIAVIIVLLEVTPATSTVRENGSAESVNPAPVTVTVMSTE